MKAWLLGLLMLGVPGGRSDRQWMEGEFSAYRFVDNEFGVVCYVATHVGSSHTTPAIQCLRQRP